MSSPKKKHRERTPKAIIRLPQKARRSLQGTSIQSKEYAECPFNKKQGTLQQLPPYGHKDSSLFRKKRDYILH